MKILQGKKENKGKIRSCQGRVQQIIQGTVQRIVSVDNEAVTNDSEESSVYYRSEFSFRCLNHFKKSRKTGLRTGPWVTSLMSAQQVKASVSILVRPGVLVK